jgi:hypothetical protein
MPQLTGSSQPISLGQGYAVRSPGIRGVADLKTPNNAATRARTRAPEDGTAELDAALAAANVTEVRRIELQLQPTTPAEVTRSLRSVDGQESIELEVPDAGPDTGQLVLACDEAGILTWHLPVDDQLEVQRPATRGTGGVKRFRIPATQPSPAPAADAAKRGFIGIIGRKVLKVLVYPVTDPIIGAISDFFAERWEGKNRPYGLRSFTPENRKTPGAGELTSSDWDQLTSGRALLFIHGTFSTAHGGFAQIPDDTFKTLYERYGKRVFAFNHFTLSHDPKQNIDWLVKNLPAGRNLEVDIVCHSRGGLVARTLAESPTTFGLDTSRVNVRRIAFVTVPNQGTALAHPDHMVKMIDRFTSALNLFPTGPVTETLEALITAVKMIGHGALKGLDGLASMRPDGAFMRSLNAGTPSGEGYYAIAVDYEPMNEGLRALVTGKVADVVLDRVFGDNANDLVVPEAGVYSKNGCGAFPIARLLQVPSSAGVIHTTVFGHPAVGEKLREWLT